MHCGGALGGSELSPQITCACFLHNAFKHCSTGQPRRVDLGVEERVLTLWRQVLRVLFQLLYKTRRILAACNESGRGRGCG